MDRSLTFHAHLKKSAAKLATGNNLLSACWPDLCGGAQASTLRTSALAICATL